MKVELPVQYSYHRYSTNADAGIINFSGGHTAPLGGAHLLLICQHSPLKKENSCPSSVYHPQKKEAVL